jgi:hypothetical protein
MKDVSEITVCTIDYGKFIWLAERMGEVCAKSYYYSPFEWEFEDIYDTARGDGLFHCERLDEFMEPSVLRDIDLFIFPDIGYGGLQRYLRSIGKAVWGSMGASELELYRTRFITMLKQLGLPMVPSVKKVGLTALAEHLKTVKDKWIKINRYRAVMETWHHQDYDHSMQKLDSMAVRLGGLKEHAVFVVQDTIDSDVEIGYDGWTVNGRYPSSSFQGYELKNELYLGSVLKREKLPKQVQEINEAVAPLLSEYQYRNFIATEIRVKDDVPHFIDPTNRTPGLTGDHLARSCKNLPEVIWRGANGELVDPEFIAEFAAVATLHCKTHVTGEWFTLNIPEEVRPWTSLYHYCIVDGLYHFIPSPPLDCDEPGVVMGLGDTIEDAIEHLQANMEKLKDEPVSAEIEGFAELLNEVKSAEKEGMEFTTQEIPEPSIVME